MQFIALFKLLFYYSLDFRTDVNYVDLITFSNRIGMDLSASDLTLDSGFDSKVNHKIIKEQGLILVIYPNRWNAKEPIAIARRSVGLTKIFTKNDIKLNELSVGKILTGTCH